MSRYNPLVSFEKIGLGKVQAAPSRIRIVRSVALDDVAYILAGTMLEPTVRISCITCNVVCLHTS